MSDTSRTAQQLAAITSGLLGMFADYCQRTASPELAELLAAYRAQRLDLVLTVHASMTGTEFVCCALPLGNAPSELVQLFTVQSHPGRIH